jgi:tRNA(Ile)-lysidine synthase
MLKEVCSAIKKYNLIEVGEGIVVGVSGGYDSICLLHVLYSISDEFKIKLYPVHINHMLRGQEADRDEQFVEDFCNSLGLEPIFFKIDVAKLAQSDKISLEEAGRKARYDAFDRVAGQKGASKIAVAHNRNDQAETVLMRIIRGAGLEGLRGMSYKRDNIIRPLLGIDRKSIEEYVHNHGLHSITDSSNLETHYFRNKIRLNVLPAINSAAGADVSEHLLRLSAIAATEDDFLQDTSQRLYDTIVRSREAGKLELDLEPIKQLHPAMQNRVIRLAIKEVSGELKGIEYVHVEQIISLINDGRTGASIDIPSGLRAVRSYETLSITTQQRAVNPQFEKKLAIPGQTFIEEINVTVNSEIINVPLNKTCKQYETENKENNSKYFDYEKINKDITIRNRLEGDLFKPIYSNGTKKLKKYFIDCKIPRDMRDKMPLIATGKEIIWIVGNKTSDNYKVTDNTKIMLKLKISNIL